ncbi:hypothetical protein EON63_13075 [archaeon]|nr:MAG: hypothetical protein EON63_13075 [archaeon]
MTEFGQYQKCGFTITKLEELKEDVRGDCRFCRELNVLCKVFAHGATNEEVTRLRALGNPWTGGDGANLYYLKGNEVYDFWCAVVIPNAVALQGKKLKFKDETTQWGWTRDVDELYVRDCYTSAIDDLERADMAMLEGTPGIGKSLFIFYYIYVVVTKARQKGENVPTFLISDRDGTGYFLGVDSNGCGIVHKPTTERTPDYLITDTKGRSNPSFTKQYIHVSSINNVNVKDVRKLMEQRKRKGNKTRCTIYLPGFSLDEYFEIDGGGETNQVSMFVLC